MTAKEKLCRLVHLFEIQIIDPEYPSGETFIGEETTTRDGTIQEGNDIRELDLTYDENCTHIYMLAVENLIAATAPTYYGKWIDESYKAFQSACGTHNRDIEFVFGSVYSKKHDIKETMSHKIILTTSAVPIGQTKTVGKSMEAEGFRRLAKIVNNIGLIGYKDKSNENYQVCSNNGSKVYGCLDVAVKDLVDASSLIFMPSALYFDHEEAFIGAIKDIQHKIYIAIL